MRRSLLMVLACATLASAQPPQGTNVNADHPGEKLDLSKHLAPGKITIVHFDSGMCGFCPFTAASLGRLCAQNPQYAYRYVEMGQPGSPLAEQYGVKGIFGFVIYDAYGRKQASGKEAYSYLEKLYSNTQTPDAKGHFQNL